jgi:hypothetical protein
MFTRVQQEMQSKMRVATPPRIPHVLAEMSLYLHRVAVTLNTLHSQQISYMIYLSTAIGLPPGGSSTVHIYTQTIHRTQKKQYIEQHTNFGKVRAVPCLGELYPGICPTTELLIMLDTLLLVLSLHCNTSLHFTTLHPTTLHYTYRHFTSSHLYFTALSFGLKHLHILPFYFTSHP